VVNRERMAAQLEMHEGFRGTPYRCSADKLTIGIGYNVDARGWDELEQLVGRRLRDNPKITRAEARKVLYADIDSYEARLRRAWPFYDQLDEVRQRVCLDMYFNMGGRLASFRNTKRYAERKDWKLVAAGMMQSLWASQVGDGLGRVYDRAERLRDMVLTGRDWER
jgi:lysozyme